jgi:class 3 adenylate cyclase
MRDKVRDINSARTGNASPRGQPPRRLVAIVAGDIAGYSRLMELDEEATHVRVKRIERDLLEPTIAEHHGRLVKTTGDGFFAIFDSPVEAVCCGIVIQQNMFGRNVSLAKEHWIEYRIGVNLGDVIIEADDIYGDGVNVLPRVLRASPIPERFTFRAASTSRSRTSWFADISRSEIAKSRTSPIRCASTGCFRTQLL